MFNANGSRESFETYSPWMTLVIDKTELSRNRLDFQRGEFPIGVSVNETMRQGREASTQLESRFANRVQRQALDALIGSMDYKPAALIINGDLTDFGHLHQLGEFRVTWWFQGGLTEKQGPKWYTSWSDFRSTGMTVSQFHCYSDLAIMTIKTTSMIAHLIFAPTQCYHGRHCFDYFFVISLFAGTRSTWRIILWWLTSVERQSTTLKLNSPEAWLTLKEFALLQVSTMSFNYVFQFI